MERARLSPAGLAKLTVPDWTLMPITSLINRVFMMVAIASLRPDDRELDKWRRVILAVPPRAGKSEICSINGPAWYLGHNPHKMVAVVSYEATFAEGFGAVARNTLQTYGPQVFGVVTDPSSEAKDWWGTFDYRTGMRCRGGMRAMGWQGPMIGKGFNLLVIDDPTKNAQEALSAKLREDQQNWWQSTAKTRIEPGGSCLIVQQRWTEDDLPGHLMREEGLFENVGRGGWTPIIVPLRAEPINAQHVPGLEGELPDPLGRPDGELLETRFSDEEMEEREKTTDVFWWSAQYQQRPTARAGTLFARSSFRAYEELPKHYRLLKSNVNWIVNKSDCMKIVTVDLAASMETKADFFCVGVWAVTPNKDLLLLDVIHTKLEGPDQDAALEGVWVLVRPSWMAVDSNSYQLTMIQRLKRRGMAIKKIEADRDKYSRASLAATRMDNEGIFFPAAGRKWKEPCQTELLNFPYATHDDYVDMISFAATVVEPAVLGGRANVRIVG